MAGSISPVLLTQYLGKLKQPTFENNIAYMYVDSEGYITVGVGHNLSANGDQASLPFKVKRFERHSVIGGDTGVPITSNKVAGRPATATEIQNDFNFLNHHKGLGNYTVGSGKLEKYTTLAMNQIDIDQLFTKDLGKFVDQLRAFFGTGFDNYPVPCQAALIDLQFNTGNVAGFPTLVRAVKGLAEFAGKSESDRWAAAATLANRPQVAAARNLQVTDWFNQGAASLKKP